MADLVRLDQIAAALDQNRNSLRIKKLMFAVCNGVWENDQNRLNLYRFQDLISELRRRAPSLEALRTNLFQIANTLNKKAEYLQIANFIVDSLRPLYPAPRPQESQLSPAVKETQPGLDRVSSSGTLANSPELKVPLSSLPTAVLVPPQHWFDVRMEIMKYANPLQAKILLFSSLIHHFTFSQQDWFSLKTYCLDQLLTRLCQTCTTLQEVELKLNQTANFLEPVEQHRAVGAVILRALQVLPTQTNSAAGQDLTQQVAIHPRPE
uniref:Uncharacterized protein n=1 Tax=Cyanothece sp. (strain PCC 7425 / ATCC 29141) TaxID=395961 RepID=B8HLG0_CYAP4